MSGWLARCADWIEHHPGTAGWAQALGATLAVIAAVLVPALQARNAARQREADRRLRAKSLAIAIYPELLHIRVGHRRARHALIGLVETAGRGPQPGVTGAELAAHARPLLIPITDALRAMVPDFYLLGEPIGPQVQMCIGRSMKYNDVLNTLFNASVRVELARLRAFIENGMKQLDQCIRDIEQTWHIAADESHGLEVHLTAQVEAVQMAEHEVINKETV